MRYLIFGAGSIGSVFGGFLARQGNEVFLIGRKPHVDAIRNKGIHISGIWGEHVVPLPHAYSSIEELPVSVFDVIFIAVKSPDTESAVSATAPLLSQDGLMVSLQNGLGNTDIIGRSVGAERTVGGRVIFGVEFIEPGSVKVTVYADKVMLGSPGNRAPADKIRVLVDTLNEASLPSEFTTEIEKYIWAKVLYNIALNPLSTILGTNYGYLLENDFTPEIMRRIVGEALDVARAHGIHLFWKQPDEYIDVLFNRLIPATAAHHPSMLQDIQRRRRTEIDALNGAIVKLAQQQGIPIPVNHTITLLIKSMEQKFQCR